MRVTDEGVRPDFQILLKMDEYNDTADSISVDPPEDCISDILSLTSPRDASRAAAISKTFNTAVDSDFVLETLPDVKEAFAIISREESHIGITSFSSSSVTKPQDQFLPPDCRQLVARAVAPVDIISKKTLYMYLSHSHVLLDRGTLGLKLDRDTGKKCFMLGAKDLSIAWHDDTYYWQRGHVPESRFAEVAILREAWAHEEAPTQHAAPTTRNDGWMEIELGEFYHDDGDEVSGA
nr:hypothetical protein [Tanacetum cinerariifolium]